MNFKEKELSLNKILVTALRVFFKHIVFISILCLIIFIPISIVNAIIVTQQMEIIMSLGPLEQITEFLNKNDISAIESMLPTLKAITQRSIFLILVTLFFQPLGKMGIAYITQQELFGIKLSFNNIIEKTFAAWKTLFFATTMYTLMLFFSMILSIVFFLIPLVIFIVLFEFYSLAIILSKKNAADSLKYSFTLVRLRFFKTFLFVYIFAILNYLTQVLIISLTPFEMNFLTIFILNVITSILSSYFFICNTLWYLNLEYIQNGGVYFDKSA